MKIVKVQQEKLENQESGKSGKAGKQESGKAGKRESRKAGKQAEIQKNWDSGKAGGNTRKWGSFIYELFFLEFSLFYRFNKGKMADKQFSCELCSCSYVRIDSLRRHIKEKHPNHDPKELTQGKKDKDEQCPYCKKVVKRLDHHCCKEKPVLSPPKEPRTTKRSSVSTAGAARTPSGATARPAGSTSLPSTSGATPRTVGSTCRSTLQDTRDAQAMIPEILEKFKAFCKSGVGKELVYNSIKSYESAIKAFLRQLMKENNDVTAPWKLMNVSDCDAKPGSGQYMSLPNPVEYSEAMWPNKEQQASSRRQFYNAFIKLCDYLLYQLDKKQDCFKSMDDLQRRKNWIKKQRNIAQTADAALQKLDMVYREQRLQNQRALENEEPEVPEEVIQLCLDNYFACEKRQAFLEALGINMKPIEFLHNEETIRDFLMLETWLQAAGARPDSIKNMKWKDFLNATRIDKKSYMILVPEHKTSKQYGSQKIIVPWQLHDLIQDFCCYIYPDHFKIKTAEWKAASTDEERTKFKTIQHDDYIFVTRQGNRVERYDRMIDLWKKFVPESFGHWNVTAYDYRRFCETKYQSSTDADVRENAPATIGHSRATAEKNYKMHSKKVESQQKFKAIIVGHDKVYGKERNDDAPVSSASKQLVEMHKDDLREKNRQRTVQQEEESFKETGRHKLRPSERDVLRETFDHLNRQTLLISQINEALETSQKLARIFAEVKERLNYTDKKVKELFKESYRSIHRNPKK